MSPALENERRSFPTEPVGLACFGVKNHFLTSRQTLESIQREVLRESKFSFTIIQREFKEAVNHGYEQASKAIV